MILLRLLANLAPPRSPKKHKRSGEASSPRIRSSFASFATAFLKTVLSRLPCRKSVLHNFCIPIQLCDILIGYARASTDDQDLRLQRAALKEAGCKRTFEEKISGAKRDRPQLAKMIEQLRDEDTVVVTRLDRLARSTRDLLDIAERLKEVGAGLRSLAEPWADTTSPVGRMVLTVFAGIAEFERELIHQRTGRGQGKRGALRPSAKTHPRSDRTRQAIDRRRHIGARSRQAAQMPSCHHAIMPHSTGR
jgi:DNA invertase Pin-like site-specific DNA recombinase